MKKTIRNRVQNNEKRSCKTYKATAIFIIQVKSEKKQGGFP
jgi:hypothetical protein